MVACTTSCVSKNSLSASVLKARFLLKAQNPRVETYFALPDTPAGPSKLDYKGYLPSKIFDRKNDPLVLIGEEYRERQDLLGATRNICKSGKKTRGEILDL